MKKRNLVFAACLFVCVVGLIVAQESSIPAVQAAEDPVSPLKIALSFPEPEHPVVFRVDLENAGDADVMVNLGRMLTNGRLMDPCAIHLLFVDDKGKSTKRSYSDPHHSFVSGRIDDFVVPLRAGSSYSLRLSLDDYWNPKMYGVLPAGEYRIQAILEAEAVKYLNDDMEGMTTMNIWTGSVSSTPLTVKIGTDKP